MIKFLRCKTFLLGKRFSWGKPLDTFTCFLQKVFTLIPEIYAATLKTCRRDSAARPAQASGLFILTFVSARSLTWKTKAKTDTSAWNRASCCEGWHCWLTVTRTSIQRSVPYTGRQCNSANRSRDGRQGTRMKLLQTVGRSVGRVSLKAIPSRV